MIEIVNDPWSQDTDDCAVFSFPKAQEVTSKYYVRLNDITFRLDYQDIINLRNMINGVVRDKELGLENL